MMTTGSMRRANAPSQRLAALLVIAMVSLRAEATNCTKTPKLLECNVHWKACVASKGMSGYGYQCNGAPHCLYVESSRSPASRIIVPHAQFSACVRCLSLSHVRPTGFLLPALQRLERPRTHRPNPTRGPRTDDWINAPVRRIRVRAGSLIEQAPVLRYHIIPTIIMYVSLLLLTHTTVRPLLSPRM